LSTKKERCSKDWPWGLFVDWLSRASEKEVLSAGMLEVLEDAQRDYNVFYLQHPKGA